jgi:hypothetical protein
MERLEKTGPPLPLPERHLDSENRKLSPPPPPPPPPPPLLLLNVELELGFDLSSSSRALDMASALAIVSSIAPSNGESMLVCCSKSEL